MPEVRDLKELLDLEARRVEGNGHGLASVLRRADRRRRARRVGVAVLAMAIAVSGTLGALRAFNPQSGEVRSANDPQTPPPQGDLSSPPPLDVATEVGVSGFQIDVNVKRPRAVVRLVRMFLRARKEGVDAERFLNKAAVEAYDAIGLKLYSDRYTGASIDRIKKIGDGTWKVSIQMYEEAPDPGGCWEQIDEELTVAAVDDPPIRLVTSNTSESVVGCA